MCTVTGNMACTCMGLCAKVGRKVFMGSADSAHGDTPG